ncbi:hypothetical protein CEXT_504051 [Caerostris extrusa]|uniref:Uncharacterized protein n=1 Tax=Caerostris extrusa TaxID=172846 RepID=A0AAV4VVV8_CAEEX|nr:hypothetical protein CEXT_504051 [Caerostris extrusa]
MRELLVGQFYIESEFQRFTLASSVPKKSESLGAGTPEAAELFIAARVRTESVVICTGQLNCRSGINWLGDFCRKMHFVRNQERLMKILADDLRGTARA